jgi:hypothetical protein
MKSISLLKSLGILLIASQPALAQVPIDNSVSRVRPIIERFSTDLSGTEEFFRLPFSDDARSRVTALDKGAQAELAALPFSSLSQEEKVDYLLLSGYLTHALQLDARAEKERKEVAPAIPFAETIVQLEQARRKVQPVDAEKTAKLLSDLAKAVKDAQSHVIGTSAKAAAGQTVLSQVYASRAAGMVDSLKGTLANWYRNYQGYSPTFDWWCAKPYQSADTALGEYAKYLRETVAGEKPGDDSVLIGNPIGRDAILEDLKFERIPYTPEELIRIAEHEYDWCLSEMKKASNAMGKGDDWKAALDVVKSHHAPPGQQDTTIAQYVHDIVSFLDTHDLVTIDPLCRETWDVKMLSPQEQKFWPFAAYGGQKILVAYPTDQMDYDARVQSMRANNIHFTHNVVPHELIPGHHLQGYMAERFRSYRGMFDTPFLVEGWALYWEMLLYDMDWPRGPEDRIGMLFWRMHRCARIVVSLKFHLGEMTPSQMIDYLVDRVGHERDAATSEVRRFISGMYSPLYQVAYMIGGLQLRALHKELVESGKMTNRQFHDAVLKENAIPVDLIRADLEKTPLAPDSVGSWRFAGEP